MQSRLFTVIVCSVVCGLVPEAHADNTYTEYLIDTNGLQDGYVQFTINATPPAIGSFSCTYDFPVDCKLEALNVFLGNSASPLTVQEESNYSSVGFEDGAVSGLYYSHFSGVNGYGPNTTFNLQGLSYDEVFFNAFVPPYESVLIQGTISATPAATVTPEPSSLALIGTGLLMGAGLLRRRFGQSGN